jgi:hypothetical protein
MPQSGPARRVAQSPELETLTCKIENLYAAIADGNG